MAVVEARRPTSPVLVERGHQLLHAEGFLKCAKDAELTDEEQTHFSSMPWFVRRVLVKRIWARGFRGSLKYAHNPSIAV
jgi:hypothetical protein